MEVVAVGAPRLGREVVPHEALHRVVEGADLGVLVGVGNDLGKDLEPGHEVALVLSGVFALDGESQQAKRVGLRCIDGERDRVDARHGKDLVAADAW